MEPRAMPLVTLRHPASGQQVTIEPTYFRRALDEPDRVKPMPPGRGWQVIQVDYGQSVSS